MRIIIERGKSRYEAVPCGRRCSFARKDGGPIYNDGRWDSTHCTEDCYCPKWWFCVGKWEVSYKGNAMGLRKLEEAK